MAKKTIRIDEIATQDVYSLLTSAVGPRPIGFASTVDAKGNVNLSPFSFFNVFGANPPTLIFSPVRSMRTLENKHSLQNILEVSEVTINIVNFAMVEQMSLSSTAYEKGVNEFVKAGFTEMKSSEVKPPYVGESPVSFECKVTQVIETGQEGGAGNLVICEVVCIHLDEDYCDENGDLDSSKLDLVGRMGGNWYTRASGSSLFEIGKPIRSQGIGIDSLPDYVRKSSLLTGNELGRMGNLERLPTAEEVEIQRVKRSKDIYPEVKKLLDNGNAMQALSLLMANE